MTLTTLPPIFAAFIFSLFCLYPTYRVFKRAGLNKRFSILVLLPFLGLVIVMGILAHTPWKTVPPLKKKEK